MQDNNALSEQTIVDLVNRNKDPGWLVDLRFQAWRKYQEAPLPKEREEEWRYTYVDKLDLQKIFLPDFSHTVKMQKAKGAIVMSMKDALVSYPQLVKDHFMRAIKYDRDKFSLLHTAFWNSGVFVYVPAHTKVEDVLQIEFLGSGSSLLSHSMIIVDKNSELKYFEKHSGDMTLAGPASNQLGQQAGDTDLIKTGFVEIFAKENAKVDFYTLQNWDRKAYNFGVKNLVAEKDSRSRIIFGSFGGKFERLRIDSIFNGEGSECDVLGFFAGNSNQHIDLTTNSYHNVPNTKNNIMAKGVLRGNASSVYRGLIKIDKVAQKTVSYLSDHTLKLSEESVANSIPSLQIEANDVKASHGATVGQVDSEQLFYLMSRGLTREQAEKLIVEGFFEPIIGKVVNEDIRNEFRKLIRVGEHVKG